MSHGIFGRLLRNLNSVKAQRDQVRHLFAQVTLLEKFRMEEKK